MAYTPTEWVSGTIISASKLNNIERGVESVNSEYTPTTWEEGDTVTAAKLNKIEQGIANASGGGGGGGDLSTAQVTLVKGNSAIMVQIPCVGQDEFSGENMAFSTIYLDEPATVTVTALLYNGYVMVWSADSDIVEVEGNATLNDGSAFISGDCTVTFE